MKSLKELTTEISGVRLNATNISAWHEGGLAVSEYVRVAINDALGMFGPLIADTYNSAVADGRGTVVALPRRMENIIEVRKAVTGSTEGYPVKHYTVRPTPFTNMMEIHADVSGRLEVDYYRKPQEFPADVFLTSYSVTTLEVSADSSRVLWWEPPATVRLSHASYGEAYETVVYNTVSGNVMANLTRAVDCAQVSWTAGTRVSWCIDAPYIQLRPVILQAEANMYGYWVRDRALYDKYTAIASIQASPMSELLMLINNLEGRAHVAHVKVKPAPRVGTARLRKGVRR